MWRIEPAMERPRAELSKADDSSAVCRRHTEPLSNPNVCSRPLKVVRRLKFRQSRSHPYPSLAPSTPPPPPPEKKERERERETEKKKKKKFTFRAKRLRPADLEKGQARKSLRFSCSGGVLWSQLWQRLLGENLTRRSASEVAAIQGLDLLGAFVCCGLCRLPVRGPPCSAVVETESHYTWLYT